MAGPRVAPLRIALLSYSTRPRGSVVHTLALAEALAQAGQDVTVWTLGRAGARGFFRAVDPRVGQKIVPFPDVPGEGAGPRVLRSIAVLADALDPAGYDVVHAQDCISANAAGSCVRTVHHLDHVTTPELAACHERAIRAPAALICVSAAVARDLAEGWGLGATVIPGGVGAVRFAAAAAAEPAALAARRSWQSRLGRYILSIGGIEPRKGSLELLAAYAELAACWSGPQPVPELVVAGGETLLDYRGYRDQWERRARQLRVSPIVLGPVEDDALPSLVAAAAVFAFPSAQEGFGLAAMEALAAGVPLVVSDRPVFREIFSGAARFAAGPGALTAALRDALTRPDPRLRAAGLALASRYTWQAAAAEHLRLYRTLAARPGAARP